MISPVYYKTVVSDCYTFNLSSHTLNWQGCFHFYLVTKISDRQTDKGKDQDSSIGPNISIICCVNIFQKTTYLLVSVVVVFMCSWFPLNFLNVLLDLGFYKHLFRYQHFKSLENWEGLEIYNLFFKLLASFVFSPWKTQNTNC